MAAVTLMACKSDAEKCLAALKSVEPEKQWLCERAWQRDHVIEVAIAGARLALTPPYDDAALERWVARAPNDTEGARILMYRAERQLKLGNATEAAQNYRQALDIQVDRDPLRAVNSALGVVLATEGKSSPEETIRLLRVVWQQASRSDNTEARSEAADDLIPILIDMGELRTAEALFRLISDRSDVAKDRARARIEAALGHSNLAASLFERAVSGLDEDTLQVYQGASLDFIGALLDARQAEHARRVLDSFEANPHLRQFPNDILCRLAAYKTRLLLLEGRIFEAKAAVETGLGQRCADGPRSRLLDAEGDVLMLAGDSVHAEQAWRDSADAIEAWRVSLPSLRLRSGLIAHHRESLESWLDAAASRNDVVGAVEVAQRLLGRALIDRMLDQESPAEGDGDRIMGDVLARIADSRQLKSRGATAHPLIGVEGDLVIILDGKQSTWSLCHENGIWSVRRLGARAAIDELAEQYSNNVDDFDVSARLGEALFKDNCNSANHAALRIMLDEELARIPLASLRVGGKFLVEYRPIIEILAPELLFKTPSAETWSPPMVIGDPRSNLPDAGREAENASRVLHVVPLLQGRATRDAVLAARHAEILHLAVHSVITDGRSELLLADAAVRTSELFDARVAPHLAVVASCRSEGGDDPMTSLVATFLAAGSDGVIGSKRAVEDEESEQLMRRFYASPFRTDPATSLALAQRFEIERKQPPHAWGSFSYFGTNVRMDSITR